MDRRPNAARVPLQAVWPGWIAGRTPRGFCHRLLDHVGGAEARRGQEVVGNGHPATREDETLVEPPNRHPAPRARGQCQWASKSGKKRDLTPARGASMAPRRGAFRVQPPEPERGRATVWPTSCGRTTPLAFHIKREGRKTYCQWASKMSHFWASKMSHFFGVIGCRRRGGLTGSGGVAVG